MDANTRVIINDLKIPNEEFTSDFVKIFIKYSLKDLSVYSDPTTPNPRHPLLLPDLKKEIIVTDGDNTYPNILKELGVEQHLCIFHKIMNQKNTHLKTTTQNQKKTRHFRIFKNKKYRKNKQRKIKRKKTNQKALKKG